MRNRRSQQRPGSEVGRVPGQKRLARCCQLQASLQCAGAKGKVFDLAPISARRGVAIRLHAHRPAQRLALRPSSRPTYPTSTSMPMATRSFILRAFAEKDRVSRSLRSTALLGRDLETAAACFGYTPPPTSLSVVDGGKPLAIGAETTLDLQMLAAASPGLKEIQVYEGPSDRFWLHRAPAPLALPAGERYR